MTQRTRKNTAKFRTARSVLTERRKPPKRKKPRARKHRLRRLIRRNKGKTAILLLGVCAILFSVLRALPAERISTKGYTHAAQFSDCVIVDGIDVSYAQGKDIDWKEVKKSGVDFVFLRGGYRDASKGNLHTDDCFSANIKGAKSAGLMVGVYFYSQATTQDEAREEARYLTHLVKDHEIDLPLAMDYEVFEGGRLDRAIKTGLLRASALNENAFTFCQYVEEKGYESMVYGNYDFLTHHMDGADLGERTNVWLAHYNSSTPYASPYSIWQYTSTGSVPGIRGNVDRNFWYVDPEQVYRTLSKDAGRRTSLENCRITLSDHNSRFLGFNVEPGVSVANGGTSLTEGRDYRVSYFKNTDAGTGYALVTGIGDYRDSVVVSFHIKKFL